MRRFKIIPDSSKSFKTTILVSSLLFMMLACHVEDASHDFNATDLSHEVRALALQISADEMSDEDVLQLTEQLTSTPELVGEIDRLLKTNDLMDPALHPLIFVAGESGNPQFSKSLQAIAKAPELSLDDTDEILIEKREGERLAALNALKNLGEVKILERLYDDAHPRLKNFIRMQLHDLAPDIWAMRSLPNEILETPEADPQYREIFYRQIQELPTNGLVVLDDVIDEAEEEKEWEELFADLEDTQDTFSVSPPQASYGSDATEIVDAQVSPFSNRYELLASTYACGLSALPTQAATANEIAHTAEWCNNQTISDYWNRYSFDGSWNAAMGFNSACNLNLPLGRTFNAIHLLHTASPNAPNNYTDTSGGPLRRGGNYAMKEIPKLKASCATDANASTAAKILKKKRHVTVKSPFFYNMSTAERAGVIVHEARHTERCRHNGNDGSNKCPAKSSSCDESLYDGCRNLALAPSGSGGMGYHILWLGEYLKYAKPSKINAYQRSLAYVDVNRRLNRMLDVDPGFNFTSYGQIKTCTRTSAGGCE